MAERREYDSTWASRLGAAADAVAGMDVGEERDVRDSTDAPLEESLSSCEDWNSVYEFGGTRGSWGEVHRSGLYLMSMAPWIDWRSARRHSSEQ